MNHIGDFVDALTFTSTDDLVKKVRHLPDSVGFFGDSPIWPALYKMTPYAEFDFDARHFQVDVPMAQLPHVVRAFLQKQQFIVNAFDPTQDVWGAELAFAECTKSSSTSRRPLVLNFSCTIDEHALAFQEETTGTVEVVHVGSQFHSTSRESMDRTYLSGNKILPLKKISHLLNDVEAATQIGFRRPTWIRFNLDCLSAAQGGGPQAWATGLEVRDVLSGIEWWVRQTSILGMSIGTQDVQSQSLTIKSAAQIVSTLIYCHTNRRIVSSAHGKAKSSETSS